MRYLKREGEMYAQNREKGRCKMYVGNRITQGE